MPTDAPRIPRHEPEVVAANAARRHGGDHGAASDTALALLTVAGIRVTCARGRVEDFAAAASVIWDLCSWYAIEIDEVHGHGRTGRSFRIVLCDWSVDLAVKVAKDFERACLQNLGGHDGLWVAPNPRLRIAECVDVDARSA